MRQIASFFLFAWLAAPVHGQIVTGSIVGTVRDPGGLAVPAAKVVLAQPLTGLQRTAGANDTGTFVFSGLESGAYVITAIKEGFKRAEKRGLILATGERLPPARSRWSWARSPRSAGDQQLERRHLQEFRHA